MKTLSRFVFLASLLGAAPWSARAGDDNGSPDQIAEARQVAAQLVQQIGGELRREIKLSGAVRSVVVCKYTAPEISSALSRKSGAQVKRVSLRVRNPSIGTPDPWEQKVLISFDRRLAEGEKAEQLEHSEVVSEPMGRYFRYMKAIPTGELCLQCHGATDNMTSATRALISGEYPHDRATGYGIGDIRGAVTYKKPL